jgi:hypothetical protein
VRDAAAPVAEDYSFYLVRARQVLLKIEESASLHEWRLARYLADDASVLLASASCSLLELERNSAGRK